MAIFICKEGSALHEFYLQGPTACFTWLSHNFISFRNCNLHTRSQKSLILNIFTLRTVMERLLSRCHIAVRDVLSWLFVLWISCFILKSNSPLVSGHLPILLCPWSDVIPNPWLFSPVFPSPMCIKSLSSPVCVAKVFRPQSCTEALFHSLAICLS